MLGARRIASVAEDGLASCSVHIRVFPRPRNLAESREILRVLEGYGEVVMYKHLKVSILHTPLNMVERTSKLTCDCTREIKYEPHTPAPNSILAIYQASSSVQKIINDSPFRFKIENRGAGWTFAGSEILSQAQSNHTNDVSAASNGDGISRLEEDRNTNEEPEVPSEEPNQAASNITAENQHSRDSNGGQTRDATNRQLDRSIDQGLPPKGSLTDPSILPSPVTKQQPSNSSSSPQTSQPSRAPLFKEFELKITPSRMKHQTYMERQGYYFQFTPDSRTIMAADLEGRVPLAGLTDCHVKKEEIHLRIRQDRARNGGPQPFSIRKLWEQRDRV